MFCRNGFLNSGKININTPPPPSSRSTHLLATKRKKPLRCSAAGTIGVSFLMFEASTVDYKGVVKDIRYTITTYIVFQMLLISISKRLIQLFVWVAPGVPTEHVPTYIMFCSFR